MSVTGGQVGEKVGDIRPLGVRCATVALGQEGSVLKQIGPIGRERVASQPALELQVCEEIEDQRLEARLDRAPALLRLLDRDGHASLFYPARGIPCPCNRGTMRRLTSPGEAP